MMIEHTTTSRLHPRPRAGNRIWRRFIEFIASFQCISPCWERRGAEPPEMDRAGYDESKSTERRRKARHLISWGCCTTKCDFACYRRRKEREGMVSSTAPAFLGGKREREGDLPFPARLRAAWIFLPFACHCLLARHFDDDTSSRSSSLSIQSRRGRRGELIAGGAPLALLL